MEGLCDLKRSLALALLLILLSFLILDFYRVNLFPSFISKQSHTKAKYGLPSPATSSVPLHAGMPDHESQSQPASPLVPSLGGIPYKSSSVNEMIQLNPSQAASPLVPSLGRIPYNSSSANEWKQKKGRRDIPKVEIGLRRARAAIRKAILDREQKQEPGDSYFPTGDIYRNAGAFHGSYREMEKRFKIFVYREGEPPLVHHGPSVDIYSTEGRFTEELELGNRFVTLNPEDAHVYFLPFSVTLMVTYIYKSGYDVTPLRRFVGDYVNVVANKYPFWNRSLGADHFMLSCHDWGPHASHGNPFLYNNSIRVLCNANTSEGFNPTKDATLPEVKMEPGGINGVSGGPSALERPLLAFFAGGKHGPVRPILFKHWTNGTDDDMQVYEYLPNGLSYFDLMKKSRYCLCPSGYEVASPRIAEAIYNECVPVIISKYYALPFSDVLNWTSFSVQVPVSEIPNLKTILQSIPVNRYVEMQSKLKQVQRHFTINQPPEPYDFFHMVLHSIWLRRLNIQIGS